MTTTFLSLADREKLGIFFWEDITVAEQISVSAVSSYFWHNAFPIAKKNLDFLIELAACLSIKVQNCSEIHLMNTYFGLLQETADYVCRNLSTEDIGFFYKNLMRFTYPKQ